jgi:hypothetical protein
MRTVHRTVVGLVVASALSLSLVGCDRIEGIVGDARSEISDVRDSVDGAIESFRWCTSALRLGAAVASRDVESARVAADGLQSTAPAALQGDVAIIVDAIDEAEATGSIDPVTTDEVKAAGASVLRYSQEQCTPNG